MPISRRGLYFGVVYIHSTNTFEVYKYVRKEKRNLGIREFIGIEGVVNGMLAFPQLGESKYLVVLLTMKWM